MGQSSIRVRLGHRSSKSIELKVGTNRHRLKVKLILRRPKFKPIRVKLKVELIHLRMNDDLNQPWLKVETINWIEG